VTLARIEKVHKPSRSLYLSACDLVEGTPVLDIKPYVPMYDSVDDARVPLWIDETIYTRNIVEVRNNVYDQVKTLQASLKQYYNDADLFMKALIETIEADVRSKFQTKKRIQDCNYGQEVEVPFDNLLVRFLWKDERLFEITQVLIPPAGMAAAFNFAENAVEEVDLEGFIGDEQLDEEDT
jgi:hypothetical protein